jgi:sporulation protein YlmC with PRC-barrel domain
MMKSMGLALLAFLMFTVNAPSFAQTASAREQQLYRGSRIIGSAVRDAHDRKIGDIKDIVLDPQRGEIAYAVVSFGGVMGVGRKYHAIPWRVLEAGDDGRYYVLHADRETISLAPGFDKGNWPDMADQKWHAEIERYWSRTVGRRPFGDGDLTSGTGVSRPEESENTSSGR